MDLSNITKDTSINISSMNKSSVDDTSKMIPKVEEEEKISK